MKGLSPNFREYFFHLTHLMFIRRILKFKRRIIAAVYIIDTITIYR